MSATNKAALESLYFGDRALFFESLADDYVCHTPGQNPTAGHFVGPDGMRRHGQQMRDLTSGTFKAAPRATILVDDDFALVPTRVRASRPDGRQLDMDAFGVWRFVDGKIAEHWEMPLDMDNFDAFWRD